VPGWSLPELILKQGQAFRRSFWVGSLAETEALTAFACGGRGKESEEVQQHVPADGGTWFFEVNGRRFPVRERGGWKFRDAASSELKTPYDILWTSAFDLPLDCLQENEWNTVAIGSLGSGPEFLRLGGTSDWILPEERCWCPRVRA